MKLKLQFYKTNKAVAVSVLECEGIPATKDCGNAILVSSYGSTHLLDNSEMILNDHETGKIDSLEVDNPEEYIFNLAKNITRELFASRKREVKVGDVVEIDDDGVEYTVIHILPEEYYNRYIVTSNRFDKGVRPFDKPKVYALPSIPLVNEKFTIMKDITDTDNVITYTWEI